MIVNIVLDIVFLLTGIITAIIFLMVDVFYPMNKRDEIWLKHKIQISQGIKKKLLIITHTIYKHNRLSIIFFTVQILLIVSGLLVVASVGNPFVSDINNPFVFSIVGYFTASLTGTSLVVIITLLSFFEILIKGGKQRCINQK